MTPLPLLLRRIGKVIRTLRTQAGHSQDRFASAIGVHRTYMGLLERGLANPTMKTLQLVAQGLGISILDLFTLAMTEDSAAAAATRGRGLEPSAGKRQGGKRRNRDIDRR